MDTVTLTGPMYFNAPDVRVVLVIAVDGPAGGRSLNDVVDEATGDWDNVTRTETTLGGKAAVWNIVLDSFTFVP